jgi:hypothetical protein
MRYLVEPFAMNALLVGLFHQQKKLRMVALVTALGFKPKTF